MTELHADIAVLAPLLGTWSGIGSGEYPTIRSFGYLEEIDFAHTGRPFLTYTQRTRAADDGRPLHAETGYLRAPSANRIEWVLAHPTGVTEIEQGSLSVAGDVLEMDLLFSVIGLTDTAKEITSLARRIRIDGDDLTYELRMAAVGYPLRRHLSARLHRQRP